MARFDGARKDGTQTSVDYLHATIRRAQLSTYLSILPMPLHMSHTRPLLTEVLRNKLAHVFGCLFRADYPEGWPNFFGDVQQALLSTAPPTNDLNPGHVAMFIDIIIAIDTEVVSTEVSRSPQDFAFANSIVRIRRPRRRQTPPLWLTSSFFPNSQKDAMRPQAVPMMVQLWYNLLIKYRETHPALVVHILTSIKPFIRTMPLSQTHVGLVLTLFFFFCSPRSN